MKDNKRIRKEYLLIPLVLLTLACNIMFADPFANLSASLPTATELLSPTATRAATATQPADTCRVIAEALHLRDQPGLQGTVIAWLKKDDQLTILSASPMGDWRKVMTAENITGWINANYCMR